MWPAVFNCSSSSIPVTTWCVCMYYAMYCGGALIKNHGPCSGRGWTRSRWSLSCSPAAAPTQVTTVSRSDSLKTLASRSHGSWLELQTAHQRRIFTEFGLGWPSLGKQVTEYDKYNVIVDVHDFLTIFIYSYKQERRKTQCNSMLNLTF